MRAFKLFFVHCEGRAWDRGCTPPTTEWVCRLESYPGCFSGCWARLPRSLTVIVSYNLGLSPQVRATGRHACLAPYGPTHLDHAENVCFLILVCTFMRL